MTTEHPGKARVLVVGSLNVDLTLAVDAVPRPGETVLAGSPSRSCGGKGANQAVAAARAGATVAMVGCIGRDDGAAALLDQLNLDGIDTSRITRSELPTGLAIIAVEATGENAIIVAPGANSGCTPEVVAKGLADLVAPDIVVVQAEIPTESITAAAEYAARANARLVLNLAPPVPINLDELPMSVLIVNEHEARSIGKDPACSLDDLALELAVRLSASVLITLGGAGVLVAEAGQVTHLPPYQAAEVIDTSGAGDAFVGAFSAALAHGAETIEAAQWGSASGAIAVAAHGAQGGNATSERIQRIITPGRS